MTGISINGEYVACVAAHLIEVQGKTNSTVYDNGAECTARPCSPGVSVLKYDWTLFNGKQSQNAFVESFTPEILGQLFKPTLVKIKQEGREKIENWNKDYNNITPLSALSYQRPVFL